jgi:hypothetical protein
MLSAEVVVLVIVVIILSQWHQYPKTGLRMGEEVSTSTLYVLKHGVWTRGHTVCLFLSNPVRNFRLYSVRTLGCSK